MTHFVRIHNTMPPCYEGRETFKCKIKECGYIFLGQYQLDSHMKRIHERKVSKRKICFDKAYKSKPGGKPPKKMQKRNPTEDTKKGKVAQSKAKIKEYETQAAVASINNYQW